MNDLETLERKVSTLRARLGDATTPEAYDELTRQINEAAKLVSLAKAREAQALQEEQERQRSAALARLEALETRLAALREKLPQEELKAFAALQVVHESYLARMSTAAQLDDLVELFNQGAAALGLEKRYNRRAADILDELSGLPGAFNRYMAHASVLAQARAEGKPVPDAVNPAWMSVEAITFDDFGNAWRVGSKKPVPMS